MSDTASAIRSTIDAYTKCSTAGDIDGLVSLFTEDARQEDPVGQPPNVGHEAIRGFFENVKNVGPMELSLAQEPIIIGNEAMVFLTVVSHVGDQDVRVPFIADHIIFAADGRIQSLRAFFDPATITMAPAADSPSP
ncbi:MAG: nuclear transport factor 2 family protein [Actinomycetes bacterium]